MDTVKDCVFQEVTPTLAKLCLMHICSWIFLTMIQMFYPHTHIHTHLLIHNVKHAFLKGYSTFFGNRLIFSTPPELNS